MMQVTFTNALGNSVTLGPGTNYLINKVDGLDSPDTDLQTQRAPFQDGDTWIDELLNARAFVVTGQITLPQDLLGLAEARNSLMSVISPKYGPGVLEIKNDRTTLKLYATPNPGCKFAWKDGSTPWQAYQITWTANDPYFYDLTSTTQNLLQATALFKFPVYATDPKWRWPVGTPKAFATVNVNDTINCLNTGHAPTPFNAQINGACVNPMIYNLTTGEFLKFQITLYTGDQIAVSTVFGRKTVYLTRAGQAAVNGLGYLALGSSFFDLQLGDNNIQFSDDSHSNTAVLVLTYSNRYLGM